MQYGGDGKKEFDEEFQSIMKILLLVEFLHDIAGKLQRDWPNPSFTRWVKWGPEGRENCVRPQGECEAETAPDPRGGLVPVFLLLQWGYTYTTTRHLNKQHAETVHNCILQILPLWIFGTFFFPNLFPSNMDYIAPPLPNSNVEALIPIVTVIRGRTFREVIKVDELIRVEP